MVRHGRHMRDIVLWFQLALIYQTEFVTMLAFLAPVVLTLYLVGEMWLAQLNTTLSVLL